MSRRASIPQQTQIRFDSIVCGGGLDLTTPSMSVKCGVARSAANMECGVTGGYTLIGGYERFDGHISPSSNISSQIMSVGTMASIPALQSVISSGGNSGTVVYVNGLLIGLSKITGAFSTGDVLSVGATTIGTIDNLQAGPTSASEAAIFSTAVADLYRKDIAKVPGSGPVRGFIMFNDVGYAFRNNIGATAVDIYKSSSAGWVNVPLYKTVSFTAGTTAPADGATLAQGGVTSLIKRVVRTSGAWSGDAAGQFIIDTPSGGNFAAGAATIGGTTVTLSGIQTQLVLSPGGKFEFDTENFSGDPSNLRVYGCDGVNNAFEFDGDILVPIKTGSSPDNPSHVCCYRGYLFLSVKSTLMQSAPGLPYDFTALSGAGEIAVRMTITNMVVMPGSTTTGALGIFSSENTFILYGTSASTWNLVAYNTGTGAVAYTAKNMAQTLALDDRGVVSIQTSLQYGNFTQDSLTANIVPFINERRGKCIGATLNRSKSQYRVFYSDGSCLYTTVVNGKAIGSMPVFLNAVAFCTFDGKKNTGEDVNFIGSEDGYVYQLDKGPSFDGSKIPWSFTLNYSNARSPRVLKRYRKASVEVASQGDTSVGINIGYSLGYGSPELYQPTPSLYSFDMSVARWDTFIWDNFFWDSRAMLPIVADLGGTSENIALAFSGSSDYSLPFTINSVIIHYSPRRIMR